MNDQWLLITDISLLIFLLLLVVVKYVCVYLYTYTFLVWFSWCEVVSLCSWAWIISIGWSLGANTWIYLFWMSVLFLDFCFLSVFCPVWPWTLVEHEFFAWVGAWMSGGYHRAWQGEEKRSLEIVEGCTERPEEVCGQEAYCKFGS